MNKSAVLVIIAVWLLSALVSVAGMAAVVWVVAHFVYKAW